MLWATGHRAHGDERRGSRRETCLALALCGARCDVSGVPDRSLEASDGTHHHSAVGTLCERSGGAMNDAEKLPSYEELAEEVRQLREQFDATLQRLKQAERFRAESRQVLEEAEKILQTMDSLVERISDRVNDALRTSEN